MKSIANLAYRSTEIGSSGSGIRVLMANGDPEEHLLLAMAADHCDVPLHFSFVNTGPELLLLLGAASSIADFPDVILLDLDIRGLGAKETLEELQAHPLMCQIPVVVLANPSELHDEAGCYTRGAAWFEGKPATLSATTDFVKRIAGFAREGEYTAPDPLILSLLNADLAADIEDRTLTGAASHGIITLP